MNDKIEIVKASTDCRAEVARFLGEPVDARRLYSVWRCPFHAEKTVGAFKVWQDGFHCYSCGKHGDVFDIWEHFANRTVSESLREHANFDDGEIARRKAEIAQRAAQARARVEEERARQLEKLHASERHLFYAENLRNSLAGQAYWMARGLEEEWQAFFGLGYCENFSYYGNDKERHGVPSLVIPVRKVGGEVVTIRHRLIGAPDGSRYRPEIAGLGAQLYICNPDIPRADDLIIVEGEIKAMVAYKTYDKPRAQVVGVPTKSMMASIVSRLGGRNAVVIPDPDGIDEVTELARGMDVRVLRLPKKVDDMINEYALGKEWFRSAIAQARYV